MQVLQIFGLQFLRGVQSKATWWWWNQRLKLSSLEDEFLSAVGEYRRRLACGYCLQLNKDFHCERSDMFLFTMSLNSSNMVVQCSKKYPLKLTIYVWLRLVWIFFTLIVPSLLDWSIEAPSVLSDRDKIETLGWSGTALERRLLKRSVHNGRSPARYYDVFWWADQWPGQYLWLS